MSPAKRALTRADEPLNMLRGPMMQLGQRPPMPPRGGQKRALPKSRLGRLILMNEQRVEAEEAGGRTVIRVSLWRALVVLALDLVSSRFDRAGDARQQHPRLRIRDGAAKQ